MVTTSIRQGDFKRWQLYRSVRKIWIYRLVHWQSWIDIPGKQFRRTNPWDSCWQMTMMLHLACISRSCKWRKSGQIHHILIQWAVEVSDLNQQQKEKPLFPAMCYGNRWKKSYSLTLFDILPTIPVLCSVTSDYAFALKWFQFKKWRHSTLQKFAKCVDYVTTYGEMNAFDGFWKRGLENLSDAHAHRSFIQCCGKVHIERKALACAV